MARIAQPREVAELKGQNKVHPERYRGKVPKSDSPLGNAPDRMTDEAKAIWFELESYAIPGVLTCADRYFMEFASNLIAEYREDVKGFAVGKYNHMYSALARLGMSPADRQKLAIDKPAEDNPYMNLDA